MLRRIIMGNVKYDEITYPYVKIQLLDGQAANIGINLKKVYFFIDEHKNMGRIFPYGNAYKVIRDKAKYLCGRNDVKFSKREVSSLIKHFPKLGEKDRYIKIPYKEDFIFRAIFEIVNELKMQYPLPPDVQIFVNQIRRECFYDTQSSLYKAWYNQNKENQTTINKHLLDDIFSGGCTLSQKF